MCLHRTLSIIGKYLTLSTQQIIDISSQKHPSNTLRSPCLSVYIFKPVTSRCTNRLCRLDALTIYFTSSTQLSRHQEMLEAFPAFSPAALMYLMTVSQITKPRPALFLNNSGDGQLTCFMQEIEGAQTVNVALRSVSSNRAPNGHKTTPFTIARLRIPRQSSPCSRARQPASDSAPSCG